MKFRSVNILIRGKCKHFFSLRLISPVFCFPFARLSGFCRFLRLFARRLLPFARMDVVGTFRWHQVTFFLRFVTLSRRSVTPARRLVTYRPRDGMFTARGTVSIEPAEKSNGDKEKRDEAKGKRDEAKEKNVDVH